MFAPALSLAAALLCTASGATKVALVPLPVGEGVSDKAAQAMTEAITGEIRRVPGVQLITQDEITALLGLERQKGLLGCGDEKCMTEIGGALGVDRLVTGRLSKLGETWMFTLKALDPKKAQVVAQVDRNTRKASIDDMIEQIPAMVGELFGAAPTKGPMRTVEAPKADPAKPAEPAPVAPAAGATPVKFGPNGVDEPIDPPLKTDGFKAATDGKGHYLVFAPKFDSDNVFSGDGKVFYKVRVRGGGSDGTPGQFDYTLWDPRHMDSWSPASGFESAKGKYLVTCGSKKKVEIEFKELSPADTKKLLKGAKFFKPRWRRMGTALARNDEGHYFYVDEARDPANGERDLRFYMGTKGKMQGYALNDYIGDGGGQIFVTTAGRLKLATADGKVTAEWIVGGQKTPLTFIDLDKELSPAQLIYNQLGVYAGEKLGQPCDALLAK